MKNLQEKSISRHSTTAGFDLKVLLKKEQMKVLSFKDPYVPVLRKYRGNGR